MYSLKPSDISFEDMLLEIADRNSVNKYNFVFYVPPSSEEYHMARLVEPGRLKEEIESTIRADLAINADYFKSESLHDLSADLLDSLKEDIYDFLGSVGISSQVNLKDDRRKYHMKHIDFACPTSEQNLENVRRELEEIKSGSGWLVNSGNSYHFHGKWVLPYREWRGWMEGLRSQVGKDANDTDILVGNRKPSTSLDLDWPYIQLARNFSILRVMQSPSKREPKIIAEIEEK